MVNGSNPVSYRRVMMAKMSRQNIIMCQQYIGRILVS
jgi:hypothetical protein